ncbi:MAG: hypothetical protein FWE10_06000 [Rikenellaceae bacterium]|nr:hypothetical protein [Rikenellaceae bacterium]MCL2692958.1 hypothetical protein [Rikenellaceae bacterium]
MTKCAHNYIVTPYGKECSICGDIILNPLLNNVTGSICEETPDYIKEIEAEIEEQGKSVTP